MESDTWQHVEHPRQAGSQLQQAVAGGESACSSAPPDTDSSDVVLLPTKCELTVSINTGKHSGTTHVRASVKVDRLQMQVNKAQIADVACMQDQYAVWLLRNQYAILRPTGWRSSADSTVTPRQGICHLAPFSLYLYICHIANGCQMLCTLVKACGCAHWAVV